MAPDENLKGRDSVPSQSTVPAHKTLDLGVLADFNEQVRHTAASEATPGNVEPDASFVQNAFGDSTHEGIPSEVFHRDELLPSNGPFLSEDVVLLEKLLEDFVKIEFQSVEHFEQELKPLLVAPWPGLHIFGEARKQGALSNLFGLPDLVTRSIKSALLNHPNQFAMLLKNKDADPMLLSLFEAFKNACQAKLEGRFISRDSDKNNPNAWARFDSIYDIKVLIPMYHIATKLLELQIKNLPYIRELIAEVEEEFQKRAQNEENQ